MKNGPGSARQNGSHKWPLTEYGIVRLFPNLSARATRRFPPSIRNPAAQRGAPLHSLRPLHRLEARNGNEPLGVRPQPAQRSLGRRVPVLGQDIPQRFELGQGFSLRTCPKVPGPAHIVLGQLRVGVKLTR